MPASYCFVLFWYTYRFLEFKYQQYNAIFIDTLFDKENESFAECVEGYKRKRYALISYRAVAGLQGRVYGAFRAHVGW